MCDNCGATGADDLYHLLLLHACPQAAQCGSHHRMASLSAILLTLWWICKKIHHWRTKLKVANTIYRGKINPWGCIDNSILLVWEYWFQCSILSYHQSCNEGALKLLCMRSRLDRSVELLYKCCDSIPVGGIRQNSSHVPEVGVL